MERIRTGRMMKWGCIACLGWLVWTSGLSAQEKLSLSDAIQRGLERNYDIRIQEKQVDVAENNNNWGEAGRYPTVNFTLDQANNITDNVKTASPFQPQGAFINNSLTPGVDLNWTLFNGFKASITKHKLEQLQLESQGNADVTVANTIQAIILGYYTAVLEGERLKVLEESKKLSRDKYDYLQVKKGFGAAVTSDLLLEEGNYLTDSIEAINQELVYRNAVRNLNVLLAEEDINKTYDFQDAMERKIETYEYKRLEDKMLQENLDLKKQFLSQSVLKYERQTRQAERMPLLSLNLSGSSNNSQVDL